MSQLRVDDVRPCWSCRLGSPRPAAVLTSTAVSRHTEIHMATDPRREGFELRRTRNEPRHALLILAIRVALGTNRLILRRRNARDAEDARENDRLRHERD